ncbi:hypothetical protein [Rhodococcus qingshengii]|uniref:hypothetical protein n=1 Tax=Rhodococcus qingshengii TaxID=334542 RepID=UPI0036DA66F2
MKDNAIATRGRVLAALADGLREQTLTIDDETNFDDLATFLRQWKEAKIQSGETTTIPVSRATLYRLFDKIGNALSSLKSFIDVNELDILSPLPTLLAENSNDDHAHIYGMRLHQVDEATLHKELQRSRSDTNLTGIVFWSRTLAEKIFYTSGHDDRPSIEHALMVATSGYDDVARRGPGNATTRLELMWCARAAAYACVLLARTDDTDNTHLPKVAIWKRREAELAEELRKPVTAALASFHARRATALSAGMVDEELRGLRDISNMLSDNYFQRSSAEASDAVKHHDLTFVIVRLCISEWACTQSSKTAREAFASYFPHGTTALVKQLASLYTLDRAGRAEKGNVDALIRLKTLHHELTRTPRPPGTTDHIAALRDVDVTDFLRIKQSPVVHAITFTAYADALTDLPDKAYRSLFSLDRTSILRTAHDYCRAATRTRIKGTGAALQHLADHAQKHLENKLASTQLETHHTAHRPEPTTDDTSRNNRLRSRINTLLLESLIDTPLSSAEAQYISDATETITSYLETTSGRRR